MSVPFLPTVFALPAEVTTESVHGLEQEARRQLGETGTTLVVDLASTTFLSSGGLGLLVRLGKHLSERGGGLAVARPRAPIARLLRLVGLDTVIPAFHDLESATAYFARPNER